MTASTRELIHLAIKAGVPDTTRAQLVDLYVAERRCLFADIADGLRNALDWAGWLVCGRWRSGP